MNHTFFTLSLTLGLSLLLSCQSGAQPSKKAETSVATTTTTVEVIQFHLEHRCMTCNLIEELTRECLQDFPEIPFRLVNVDDPKNQRMAETFEAFGTALFIHNPSTGKKKELTDFAFLHASTNPKKFKEGIVNALREF